MLIFFKIKKDKGMLSYVKNWNGIEFGEFYLYIFAGFFAGFFMWVIMGGGFNAMLWLWVLGYALISVFVAVSLVNLLDWWLDR